MEPAGEVGALARAPGFFRWEVTLGVAFGLITCGGVTVALDWFKITAALSGLAGLDILGCLFFFPHFPGSGASQRVIRWTSMAACVLLTGGAVWGILAYGAHKELTALAGVIEPGDEVSPKPPNVVCSTMNLWNFDLVLGGSHLYSPPTERTIIQVDDNSTLALTPKDGAMQLSMIVRSDNGNVIAEVKDGAFLINRNNYLKMNRANAHELTVYDQKDNPVLEINYPNPHVLIVNADLITNGHHIKIASEGITVDGRQLRAPTGSARFCAAIPAGVADIIVNKSGAYFGTRSGLLPGTR
jgi:hypothetical protein